MKRLVILIALALSVLVAMIATSPSPVSVQAIDPTLDAALIAIARATAQEQDRRNSVAATSAALAAQATQNAIEAKRQADFARATAQAQAESVQATARVQEMNGLATRRASDATATQQARDADATATSVAQSASATQAYNSALGTRQSGDATATVNAMAANATATVIVMRVQATAEFIVGQQQARNRNGVMLTVSICVGLFVVVLVGWRLIEYLRQSQKTMAKAATNVRLVDPVVIVEDKAEEYSEPDLPETVVVNNPQAAEMWSAILEANA